MESDGNYEQVTLGDDPVRDVQAILMDATNAAVERGYGTGMEVDTDLVSGDLLVESTSEEGSDPTTD